jgi:hypothetical protein
MTGMARRANSPAGDMTNPALRASYPNSDWSKPGNDVLALYSTA